MAAVFESISGDFAVASLLIELFGVIEHLGSGNTGAAEAACRRIVADLPQQASALHQQGRDLFQSGRFAQGCELLRQAVACHPEVIGFHKTLAEALEMQGRRMEAQAVRADMPAVKPFQSQLSPILELLQSGRLAEAELICRRVLDSLPFHCRAYGLNELGCEAVRGERLVQGVAFLKQAVAFHPQITKFHENLAIALDLQGQKLEAQAVRTALTSAPNFTTTARMMSDLGSWGKASGYEIREIAPLKPFRVPVSAITLGPSFQKMAQLVADDSSKPAWAVCAEDMRLIFWRDAPTPKLPNGSEIPFPLSRNNDMIWDPEWLRFYPFLRDVAPDGSQCTVDATPFVAGRQRIKKECFFLGGNSVYAHWMADTLPLLQAIQLAGLPQDLPIVTIQLRDWQRDTLACLGFPAERIIELDASSPSPCCSIIEFDKVWMADGFAMHQRFDYLRTTFAQCRQPHNLDEKGKQQSRVYVTRPPEIFGSNRVSNDAEICSFLEARGFKVVYGERMNTREKAELFGNADIVVCAPGSNIFNYFAFGRPECVMVNMWPIWLAESPHWTEMKLSHRYSAPFLDETVFVCGQPIEGIVGQTMEDPAFYPIELMEEALEQAEDKLQRMQHAHQFKVETIHKEEPIC